MKEESRYINVEKTLDKIISGEYPTPARPTDVILSLNPAAVLPYTNIVSALLFNRLNTENVPEAMITGRIELLDSVLTILSNNQYCRLHKLIVSLEAEIQKYFSRSELWETSKDKSIILSFIIDFWYMSDTERGELYVFDQN